MKTCITYHPLGLSLQIDRKVEPIFGCS